MGKIIGTDATGDDTLSANFIGHCKFVALSTGTVSSIDIRSSADGNCKAAIYSDDSGDPGTQLSVNNTGHACTSGVWNRISLDTEIELVEGNYYWLSYIADTTGVPRRTLATGETRFKAGTYSNDLPNPAGSGYSTGNFELCARSIEFTYSTNAIQEGDVRMWHVDDRGEIEEKDGFITMTSSFETMIYLTLFGGNEDDNNSESTALNQWWGNEGEPVERQYRSRFQHECSRGRPITSASITVIIEAAENDLKDAFVTTGYAKAVEITKVEIINPKRIRVAGFITLDEGNTESFDLEGDIS